MTSTPADVEAAVAWHALEAGEVGRRLRVDPEQGLAVEEAQRRIGTFGPNTLQTGGGRSRWELLVDQFRDVLVWVLLAAALISGVLLGDLIDAAVILAIVVVNGLIGYLQESRAEEALARLQQLAAPQAKVLREGEVRWIPAAELVPGDVIVLSQGDRVPADARLLAAAALEVDESPLTGESLPVRKQVAPVSEDAGVGDRLDMVFAGTAVAGGRGRAIVVHTGITTQMGEIAELLGEEQPVTPLQVELGRIGKRIALLAGVAAVIVFALGLLRAGDIESLLLTAVALAVAAIPEGLPAVTTITLARGMRAMAQRNAIVRRLPAVEALGSATVICTDKTGTLTRNRMRIQQMMLGDRTLTLGEDEIADQTLELAARLALLCSDVTPGRDGGWSGDATEVALVASLQPWLPPADQITAQSPRIDEIPFDSSRKRMVTLHEESEGYLLAMKGAPEVVLERCTRQHGSDEELDERRRADLSEEAEKLAAGGLRTLALAYRRLPSPPPDLGAAENDFTLLAIVGLSDELRPEAAGAVETASSAGINVVMVTGDHLVTARAIAEQIGLLRDRQVMPGSELRRLTSEELAPWVDQIGAYARVDPADKVKIVEAWQSRGDIVAMTGDGVNDAPALRIADIGVAMGSGTDVARESSDIVLADDNFATIVAAVERGRGIFANLKKVVYFLLAANISEIAVMLVGFLLFGGLGEPLLAVQLLWINLMTDGLPALALGVDPPSRDLMRRPPEVERDILGWSHQLRLGWEGAVIALGPLSVYAYGAYLRDLPWVEVRTMAFCSIVFAQLLFSFVIRAQSHSVFRTPPGTNRWLLAAVATSAALQLLVVFTPVGQLLFETAVFPAEDWLVVLAAAAVPMLIIDAVRVLVRRWRPESPAVFD